MKWPFQTELDRINKSSRNRANRKRGSRSEDIAKNALEAAGYLCVEPIETGWVILRKYDPIKKQSAIISAFPKRKVSGDFTAICPTSGKYVHIEVKSKDSNTLPYSAFEPHQIDALNTKSKIAISLIVWVRRSECKVYRWPINGFVPGKSLTWEDKNETRS